MNHWNRYAAVYDLMAEYNPAYAEILGIFEKFLSNLKFRDGLRFLDVGAGTGNFSILAARTFPASQILHLEPNPCMNSVTSAKVAAHGAQNLVVIQEPVESARFSSASFDVIISVHALYSMPQPDRRLDQIYDWLKPGGVAFMCDFGRLMRVADWASFMFGNLVRNVGLLKAMRLMWVGRQVAIQNRRIAELQRNGSYWTHTPAEFRTAVRQAGFTIVTQAVAYRGYSDVVVAQRPRRASEDPL